MTLLGGLLRLIGTGFFALGIAVVLITQILSLIDCFKPVNRKLQVLKIMPDWRFFAPKPITGGRHLLARSDDSDWEEIWKAQPGSLFRAVWNPARRGSACMYQLEASIINDHLAGVPLLESAGCGVLRRITSGIDRDKNLSVRPLQQGAVVLSLNNAADEVAVFQLILAFDLEAHD